MPERTSSPADRHPCPNGCGETYPTERGAKQHGSRYCNEARHPCPAGCGDTFKTERGADQHLKRAKKHRGERTVPDRLPDWVYDHDARWRPKHKGPKPPACGYTLRGKTCDKVGPHYCAPRADRVVFFFAEFLIHTKGPKGKARQRFVLSDWQEHEIIRPLFGEVIWSTEHGTYVRRYRIAYIVVARKNGKSELAAGILLYLLVADDEDAAEVFGAAKDTKQAGKVFEPAKRMSQLDPRLNGSSGRGLIGHNKNSRRLFVEETASYYEVITADAEGELGHNPHGFVLDEVLSQLDGSLWEAMTTATGTRLQELMAALTTETSKPYSFGAELIDEAERVQEDPRRSPHTFAFVRKLPRTDKGIARLRRLFPDHPHLPVSTDPLDEANWKWPNPALDDFKSRAAMRRLADDAADSTAARAAFCQFQVNQRRQQKTRWIDLDLWDANTSQVAPNPQWVEDQFDGIPVDAGLDLSSKLDLTAWTLFDRESGAAMWRFWVPESVVQRLAEATGGAFQRWVDDGWIVATDGDVIDYDKVYEQIEADTDRFVIRSGTYDFWGGEAVRQEIEKRTGLELIESRTTYQRMTAPMNELERRLAARELETYGNPVARWMADNIEAKSPTDDPTRKRPVKPDRNKTPLRIDGIVTLLFAIDGSLAPAERESVYETRGLAIL